MTKDDLSALAPGTPVFLGEFHPDPRPVWQVAPAVFVEAQRWPNGTVDVWLKHPDDRDGNVFFCLPDEVHLTRIDALYYVAERLIAHHESVNRELDKVADRLGGEIVAAEAEWDTDRDGRPTGVAPAGIPE